MKYVILYSNEMKSEIRARSGSYVTMMTNNKGDFNQGEWNIDGVPAGGFNVMPREMLDEDRRRMKDGTIYPKSI